MISDKDPNARKLSTNEARMKAEAYCAYQERSHQELRDKLYSWGLHQAEVEQLIAALITENFLNEERFARIYAQGKFHQKSWGKQKIAHGLKLKGVSPRLIEDALKDIDDTDYQSLLEQVLRKKAGLIKDVDPYLRKMKLARYAIGKGYESESVFLFLNANNL